VGLLIVGNEQWTKLGVLLLGPSEFDPMEYADIHLAMSQRLAEFGRIHGGQFRVLPDLRFPKDAKGLH
jgi:hypothetical protein